MAKFNNSYEYIFHLVSSVLKGTQPEELPEEYSFEEIFKIGVKHRIHNIMFYAIEKLKTQPNPELRQDLSNLRDREIVREFNQIFAFEQLTEKLTAEKIRFLPLKGIYLKDLYPQRDMRTMSDIDMVVDAENMQRVHDILVADGYDARVEEDEDHDAFRKDKILFEVHHSLFSHGGEDFHALFSDPFEHTYEEKPYMYNFDKNWFFIYLFAHLAKHYTSGGTGIRSIIDIWVYINKYNDELDFDYIFKQLKKANADELCKDIIALSKVWFDGEEMTEKFAGMTDFIIDSGVYGNSLTRAYNNVNKMGKAKFFFYRVTPPYKVMKHEYPVLQKVPVLLPFCWIYRGIGVLIFKRKNIKKELDYIKQDKK